VSTLYPVLLFFFAQDLLLNSLKSSGYRLEEMVCGFVFYEYNFFSDEPSTYQGPLKFEHGASLHLTFFPYQRFCPVGHEEVMQNAAQLQGCPVPGHWSRSLQY
jgi:hypothetical protein